MINSLLLQSPRTWQWQAFCMRKSHVSCCHTAVTTWSTTLLHNLKVAGEATGASVSDCSLHQLHVLSLNLGGMRTAGSRTLGRVVHEHRQTLAGTAGSQSYRGSSGRHSPAAPSSAKAAAHALQRPPAKQRGTPGPASCPDLPTAAATRCCSAVLPCSETRLACFSCST